MGLMSLMPGSAACPHTYLGRSACSRLCDAFWMSVSACRLSGVLVRARIANLGR